MNAGTLVRFCKIVLVLLLTIPVSAQALVLCLESDGRFAVEVSTGEGCGGCPEVEAVEHSCGCEDLGIGSSSIAGSKYQLPDYSRSLSIVSLLPFRDLYASYVPSKLHYPYYRATHSPPPLSHYLRSAKLVI